MNRYLEEKMMDLINGGLSDQEKQSLIDELLESGYDINEIEELRKLNMEFDEGEVPKPSEKMDEAFYDKLYEYQEKKFFDFNKVNVISMISQHATVWRVAAGIALFILGWYGGIRFTQTAHNDVQLVSMQNEMTNMKKMVMLTMMEQQSPTERIKAVHMVDELPELDSKIIMALLKTLNQDANDNVRLVALETLKQYAHYPQVREGLILSISKQESPLIQIALAEVMAELQEQKAVPHFEEMLMDKTLNYTVRKKVNKTITDLT